MAKAANVSVGKPKVGGAVYRAPLGTALPTDAKTQLDVAFKDMGYCSDDGVENENKISSEDIKAWGGATVATPLKEKTDNFKLTLIEALNVDVLKAIYGDENVTGTIEAGIKIGVGIKDNDDASWVIDMIMTGSVLKRMVIPSAKISDMEKITYKDNDAISYGLTLSAHPDSSENTHYEYIVKKGA